MIERNKSILIKVTADEKEIIKRNAKANGTPVSEFIRERILHLEQVPRGHNLQLMVLSLTRLAKLTNKLTDPNLRKAFAEEEKNLWQFTK